MFVGVNFLNMAAIVSSSIVKCVKIFVIITINWRVFMDIFANKRLQNADLYFFVPI